MKILAIMCTVVLFISCSFKSKHGENDPGGGTDGGGGITSSLPLGLDQNGDLDGDLVTNGQEIQIGRNPHVADLPELSVAFLQNYRIEANEREKAFTLDTKVAQSNPNFRYRVGSLFIREHALKTAASVGKFSTHTTGEITPHDLSWVKYPEIDHAFFQDKALGFQKVFGEAAPSFIKLTLENSLRLKPSAYFRSIKNVVFNFYYYDYESENYELLKSVTVDRNFLGGVNEVLKVEIENVPSKLLVDNYFKKGEFIFSEVADFEIPEMGTTYKNLLANIKAKSIPVIINTPKELRVSYVGANGGSGGGPRQEKTFAEVLAALYNKNYLVEENEIKKIGEFENNLADFTYLKEVREKDKQGKWFVLTSPFNGHYSDHRYTANDRLVLTYATGKELAEQTYEKLHGTWEKITGGDDFKVYSLGNISPNSEIHLELYPGKMNGEKLISVARDYHERPASCGQNRICGILEMDCMVNINFFEPYDLPLEFNKEMKGEIERIKIVLNDEEFSLADLIEKKAISLSWNDQNHLHISIPDPSKIMEIHEAKENVLAIKIETLVAKDFQGAKLYEASGQHRMFCPGVIANASANWKIPISESSIMMDQFRTFATRGMIIVPDKTYYQRFDFALSSLITNFYN